MSGITKQEIMDGVVPNKKIDKPKSFRVKKLAAAIAGIDK